LANGSYELRIPYANASELVMDILKHGAGVEVIEPAELRQEVIDRLQAALEKYR
jgi:proteasome accessory factor C